MIASRSPFQPETSPPPALAAIRATPRKVRLAPIQKDLWTSACRNAIEISPTNIGHVPKSSDTVEACANSSAETKQIWLTKIGAAAIPTDFQSARAIRKERSRHHV